MTESVNQRSKDMASHRDALATAKLLEAARSDIAALSASIAAITAKLDADVGVTDTNYAATCNPPAANLTE